MYRNKRPYSGEFEDNSYNNNRGPYRGQSGLPFNKRHRGDNFQQPHTIKDKISRLGDTGSRNFDIGILAKEIDADLANVDEQKVRAITSRICQCVISFPTRVASYATLIGLISVKHYNVSCQIINTLHASYPVYLEAQKWQEALIIIHLLSSLVNCKVIRPSALLSQFELLLEITQEENVPQSRSDYYVYTVLSSLPFVALELSQQTEPNNFDQILDTIEAYLSKRSKKHLDVIRVWLSNDSTVQMDYLDSLWVQTKNFRANSWKETFLPCPYNDKEYKDIMASSLIPQNSPTIQIPAHSPNIKYPTPKIVFRMYEDDVAEGNRSIPGSDKIERFCIENYVRNIIDEISTDPRDCARHLGQLYHSHPLPMKHILIETLLGELFTLPQPKHREIFYHSLLFELSKIFSLKNPDEAKFNYDNLLNEAVKVLYENLETMSITCLNRFIEWFSFHLNNVEFLFPWQSWADATFKDPTSRKYVFVQEMLNRCIRFSFHQKISTLVGAHLDNLVPPKATVEYKPFYADHPKAAEMRGTVQMLIVSKADGPTICKTLNIIVDGIELPEDFKPAEESLSDKLFKIDIFTACILNIACKSLTHLSGAIGKYRNVFKTLVDVEGGQVQLLQTMHSCLELHPHLQVILVGKLLKAELIDAKQVIKWIFSDSMKPYHLKCYPWEVLNGTIYRSSHLINKLLEELNKPVEVKQEKVEVEEGQTTPTAEDDADMISDKDIKVEVDVDVADKMIVDTIDINDQIANARADHYESIMFVFKMFSESLGDHIRKCEANNTSYMDEWYRWMTGRMQQIYYNNYSHIRDRYEEIKNIVDEIPSIGNSIVDLDN